MASHLVRSLLRTPQHFFPFRIDFSSGQLSSQNTPFGRENGSKVHIWRSSSFCHHQQDSADHRQPVPFLPHKAPPGLFPGWLSLSQRTSSLLLLTFICGCSPLSNLASLSSTVRGTAGTKNPFLWKLRLRSHRPRE